jgi:hypothetical protein
VPIGTLAPGGTVTLITTGTNINYVGTSAAVTSSTGFPFPASGPVPVTWSLPVTAAAVTLWAISVTGASSIAVAFTSTA